MVNPYKMEYKADPDGDGVSDQIISAVQSVKSSSNIALNVTATVSGKIPTGSKAVFSPTSTVNPAKPITTKSVYMYLQTELNASDETGAFGNEFDGTKDIVVGTKAASLKVGSLAAGTEDAPSILNYRLTGDAVEAPAIAWNGEDKVNVTVAFTFAPVAVEESAGA